MIFEIFQILVKRMDTFFLLIGKFPIFLFWVDWILSRHVDQDQDKEAFEEKFSPRPTKIWKLLL